MDLGRALDYFTLAARSGVAEAQHNLGAMLVSGRGVKRNYVEGLAWLIVAVKSGVGADTETQVRNRLAKRPNEIIAAESRADELVKDLAYATVQAGRLETTGKIAARTPTQTRTPPTISRTVEKPVVAFPGAPEIIFPVASGLELPSAPVKKP